MKQQDVMLIIVIGIFSGISSVVLSRFLITNPKNRSAQVIVVDKIDSNFQTPDKKYFSTNSINPTALIRVGDNTNPTPFH